MKEIFEQYNKLHLPAEISNNELFFVGGAVRSILAGENLPRDIDLCGNIDVSSFQSLNIENSSFQKQLFSYRYKSNNHDFDITAFRNEEYKKGYFPSKVYRVESAEIDSLRRDFTINAIYISKYGEILDFNNGISHIKERKIVQVTNKTLNCDGMRIYRMLRFALTLGYDIEKNTYECAVENAKNIFSITKTRASREFEKFRHLITNENIQMIEKLGIFNHLEISKNEITNK